MHTRHFFTQLALGWLCAISLAASLTAHADAPEAWSFWETHNPDSTLNVDHSAWQTFLQRHVLPQTDGINRVDYAAAATGSAALLNSYVEQLIGIDPRTLQRSEQFAYWVNLYNAVTVQVVLANPDERSIKDMGRGFLSFGPWDDEQVQIAGQAITLNDIEHRILRPIWQDPRIHFAVNCASLGCPNLQTDAFTASNTEALLNRAQVAYLNHPRGVAPTEDGVRLSSIFDWYQGDFGADERALLSYLSTHLRPHNSELAQRLEDTDIDVEFDYSWQLNSLKPR